MILNDCEIWFAKVDPKRPNAKFNQENPTWEVQLRTTDKEKKKDWESKNLIVKAIVPDEGEPYFRVNLRKKSFKVDGEPSSPVKVVDTKLNPVDPNAIGNKSIANVRVFQYDYVSKTGKPGVVTVLMGIQLTKHLIYIPTPREDEFAELDAETEVIQPPEEEESGEDSEEAPSVNSAKNISL